MRAKRYTKKPVEIRAIQFTGDNQGDIAEAFPYMDFEDDITNGALIIETLEGEIIASPGDYIIEGIKGEYYPCKPDIFEATYE